MIEEKVEQRMKLEWSNNQAYDGYWYTIAQKSEITWLSISDVCGSFYLRNFPSVDRAKEQANIISDALEGGG